VNEDLARWFRCEKPGARSGRVRRAHHCRTWLAKGYGSVPTAWRTLRGIEAMDMIRKGRVRRAGKGDVVAQVKFISKLFGIAA
jgi:hypothetical protein